VMERKAIKHEAAGRRERLHVKKGRRTPCCGDSARFSFFFRRHVR
jgi:hypothetical protein